MTTKTTNISELARKNGLKPSVVHNRMASGWSLEKALNTPARLRKAGRRKKPDAPKTTEKPVVDLKLVDQRLKYEAVVAELEAATDFNDALMDRVARKDRTIKYQTFAMAILTALVVAVWAVQYV